MKVSEAALVAATSTNKDVLAISLFKMKDLGGGFNGRHGCLSNCCAHRLMMIIIL